MKILIIVEGSSGSGKSTLSRELYQEKDLVGDLVHSSLEDLTGSRLSSEVEHSAVRSLANDHLKLAEAILSPNQVVLIDRLFLSQLVYGRIREGVPLTPNSVADAAYSFYEMAAEAIEFISAELFLRLGMVRDIPRIAWGLFIDLDVSYEELCLRRSRSGKEHPAQREDYLWYNAIGKFLLKAELPAPFFIFPDEDTLIDALFELRG